MDSIFIGLVLLIFVIFLFSYGATMVKKVVTMVN